MRVGAFCIGVAVTQEGPKSEWFLWLLLKPVACEFCLQDVPRSTDQNDMCGQMEYGAWRLIARDEYGSKQKPLVC